MTDSSDYRLYLDEKFKGLTTSMNGQFMEVHERLDKIDLQTSKTNERVSELELEKIKHIITCPQIPKIEKINTNLEDYRVFLRHPKLIIAGLVLLIALSAVGLFSTSLNRLIINRGVKSIEKTEQNK
jgi:hypothetical protein